MVISRGWFWALWLLIVDLSACCFAFFWVVLYVCVCGRVFLDLNLFVSLLVLGFWLCFVALGLLFEFVCLIVF